jgi:hypothetical protein
VLNHVQLTCAVCRARPPLPRVADKPARAFCQLCRNARRRETFISGTIWIGLDKEQRNDKS